jgi:hypothetical protein
LCLLLCRPGDGAETLPQVVDYDNEVLEYFGIELGHVFVGIVAGIFRLLCLQVMMMIDAKSTSKPFGIFFRGVA